MTKLNLTLIVVVLVLMAALGYLTLIKSNEADIPEGGEGLACTMDAKICPDGTAVGRVPPSCEFAACPGAPSL